MEAAGVIPGQRPHETLQASETVECQQEEEATSGQFLYLSLHSGSGSAWFCLGQDMPSSPTFAAANLISVSVLALSLFLFPVNGSSSPL